MKAGTLATGLSTNLYDFSGTAGERVYFEGLSDSSADGTLANLYSPSNSRVTSVALENDTPVTLPFSGTYILAVAGTSASNSSDGYSFEMYDNVNPTTMLNFLNPAVTVVPESGTIVNPGDSQSYTFTGTAGQQIYYDGLASASSSLYAELTDPFGNFLFSSVASSRDEGPFTLTYSGPYTLTIDSDQTFFSPEVTGAYGFTLYETSATPAITLTAGTGAMENSTLTTGLSTNLYQFIGTAGERVYFEGLSDSSYEGAVVDFYSPSNSRVTSVAVENDTQVTLPFSGTYILAVVGQSASNSSDGYSFEMYDNVAPSSALALNTQVTGTLTNPGDEAIYTFTGSIGQQIQFNGLVPGSHQDATLYDPEGTFLFQSTSRMTRPLHPDHAGYL